VSYTPLPPMMPMLARAMLYPVLEMVRNWNRKPCLVQSEAV
jgi:hypothetical protein